MDREKEERRDLRIVIDYLRKSYFSVDGLWFMIAEEELGFEKAVELDKKVWAILPKIQARLIKSKLKKKDFDLESIIEILKIKFGSEEYEYSYKIDQSSAEIKVIKCPWQEILIQSNRRDIGPVIGDEICQTELLSWINELNKDFKLETIARICQGHESCIFKIDKR